MNPPILLKEKEEKTSLKFDSLEQSPPNIMTDPNIVRTKGTQGSQVGMPKRRQCHLCCGYGHTKRTCS